MDKEINVSIGENTDLKKKVFFTSLRYFSTYGYENVSVGVLAKMSGVKTSTIYYCGGKEGLLNECYKFYVTNRYITRLTPAQYMPILRDGSKLEVINVLRYNFDDDCMEAMLQSFKLVLSRLFLDEAAKEIYTSEAEHSIGYICEFFENGIQIGRFNQFNIKAIATMCFRFRLVTALASFVEMDKAEELADMEVEVFNELAKMIPFRY